MRHMGKPVFKKILRNGRLLCAETVKHPLQDRYPHRRNYINECVKTELREITCNLKSASLSKSDCVACWIAILLPDCPGSEFINSIPVHSIQWWMSTQVSNWLAAHWKAINVATFSQTYWARIQAWNWESTFKILSLLRTTHYWIQIRPGPAVNIAFTAPTEKLRWPVPQGEIKAEYFPQLAVW